jgi:hypothetical protein
MVRSGPGGCNSFLDTARLIDRHRQAFQITAETMALGGLMVDQHHPPPGDDFPL